MRKKSRNTIFFTRSLKQSVRLYLFLICILSYSAVQSQVNRKALDVAKTRFVDSLFQVAYLTALPKNSVADIQIPSIIFPDTPCTKKNVPTLFMERDCFIRFDLYNSGDTAKQFYFLPGFYLHSLRVFRTRPGNPGNIIEIPSSGTEQLRGGTLLSLASHDSATFYAKFQFVRANINNYLPAIIEKDYIREFKASLKNKDELLDRITYIASGILLLMIFYSMAVYLQGKKKEFLFYSIYTFCTGILLFLKSYFDQDSGMFHFIYEEYLDFMILCIGVFFYLFFLRTFLQTKQTYVFLDRFLKIADILLIGLLSIYSMIYLFSEKYVILNIMENYVIKWFLVIIGIVFIVYSSRKKHRLLNYLALGNLALLIFSIISLMIILFKFRFVEERNSVFNRAMFYYIIGLVLELICFLLGLAYKNRKDIIETAKESERLKVDNEKKELEKQVAVM
ncbi:MAG TPA: 7TM-DISM domain-containing protein, partial [Flavitalea sp.]|nr:7TM-DISM domain-containing protein [Flavitalea sp.]